MMNYSSLGARTAQPGPKVNLPKITGWHDRSSRVFSQADYLIDGEESGISLSRDSMDTGYTLWFRGQVYQKGVHKAQIANLVQHILRNADKGFATQKNPTTYKGIPID